MSELVIRGGTVIDGTGAPGYRADVAIDVRHVLASGVPIRTDGKQDLTTRSGKLVRSAPHARASR
jgi:hypothetical protein